MATIEILDQGVLRTEDEANLVRSDGVIDNDHERTTWVEYRFPDSDVIVHRSAHVHIKQWPDGVGAVLQQLG